MYIPRPAKLLFQYDDGWNRFIDNNPVDEWQLLCVEKMLACSTCAMGVRRYCCSSPECTHSRFFCQTCKSKACSACGFKSTEQWIAQQRHILPDCEWQHITLTMPQLLWPFFNDNWTLLNQLFRCTTRAMLKHARCLGLKIGIFCALHTYGRQLNQHPHIHLSVTRGTWHNVKYLGRYLKLPPISASQLKHYSGGTVVHHYYDHHSQQYRRQTLSQEEMIRRYVNHIPARHFKMIRYYGFLANRKRGRLLPKVYNALDMNHPNEPEKPGFAALMKEFLNTDPYQCILCGNRLRFMSAEKGIHAVTLLTERRDKMAQKRWLQTAA